MKAFSFLKNRVFWLFLVVSFTAKVDAQTFEKPEFKNPRLFLSYSTMHTNVLGQGAGMRSISGGITWDELFTTGVNYYYIRSNIYRNFDETPHKLNLTYYNALTKYKLSLYNKMVFQVGLETGPGQAYYDGGNSQGVQKSHYFWNVTGLFDAYYKMLPWFGFGGEVGYRAVAFSELKLSGVLLNIKLKFFPLQFYQIIKKNPADLLQPEPLEFD